MVFQTPVPADSEFQTYVMPPLKKLGGGVVIEAKWNQIDQGGGVYDWAPVDDMIAPYLSAGLKVALLLVPTNDGTKNSATPDYVLDSPDQDICFCSDYPGAMGRPPGCYTDHADLTGFPVPFETTFSAPWQAFIAAAIAHYNSMGISYARIGIAAGGESIAHCASEMQNLVSPATVQQLETTWDTNAGAQYAATAAAKPTFPIVSGVNCNFFQMLGDCQDAANLAKLAAANGIGIGSEGLQKSDLTSQQTSNDWLPNFEAYTDVPHQLQTNTESDPTNNNALNGTGSWTVLLPFVGQHCPNPCIFEGYSGDFRGAYQPGYTDQYWPATITTPYVPYQQALDTLAAQQ